MALIPTQLGDFKQKKDNVYNVQGYDANNNNSPVFVKPGYYTPGISLKPGPLGGQQPGGTPPSQLPPPPGNSSTSAPSGGNSNPNFGSNSAFGAAYGQLMGQAQNLQKLQDQRNLLVQHLYDRQLTPDEIQKLSPAAQQAVLNQDKSLVEYSISSMNDQIKGRTDQNKQSLDYMLQGYQLDQAAAQQKQQTALKSFDAMLQKDPGLLAAMSPEGRTAYLNGQIPSQQDLLALSKAYNDSQKISSIRTGTDSSGNPIYSVVQGGNIIGGGSAASSSSTSTNTSNIAQAFADGTTGGQCGTFAHSLVNDLPPVGDTLQTKEALIDKSGIKATEWAKSPQVGDVLVMDYRRPEGHIAVVNSVNADGTVTLSESNFKGDQKVTNNRTMNVNDPKIYGAYRGGQAQGNGQIPPAKAVGGFSADAINQAALRYATDGTLPSLGLGKAAMPIKQAIINRAAELNKGGNIAANKADLKALQSSLTKQTGYLNDTQRAVLNAEHGFQQLTSAFKNAGLNTSDSSVANKWVNDFKRNFTGGDIRAYDAGLTEISNEYAQVFSRGGQMTESTKAKADSILSGNISFKDLMGIQNELQAQGKIVIEGAQAQVSDIQSQIDGIVSGKGTIQTGDSSSSLDSLRSAYNY